MLGLEGSGVYIAYILSVLSSLLCIIYGIMNWNKGGIREDTEIKETMEWEKKETKIVEKL